MNDVQHCPETGLYLLPRGSEEWTRWLPSWDDLRPVAREVVLAAIATTRGGPGESWQVPVTLGLLPDLDNDYNDRAVAVILPDPLDGRLEMSRQIAWVKNDHVRSLQPSVTALMDATGGFVGCHGLVELSRYVAGENYDEDEDEDEDKDEDDDWGALTESECRRLERTFSGFRASIHSWDVVRAAVLDVITERVTDHIVPMIGHRSPLTPDARAVRDDLRDRGRMQVILRAQNGYLDAYIDDLHLSRLHPAPRKFFAITHARVEALGGTATAQAQAHEGSLEVWVEDSRSPD